MSVMKFRQDNPVSIRRLALAFNEAVSTVGRWVGPKHHIEPKRRHCPVSGNADLRCKVWHKPWRPKRVERMKPSEPNRGWQIDMTCFVLSDMSMAYLVGVIDCCTRQIVGWSLSRRARADEWTAAVRMALESKGLASKDDCRGLVLRSDNGSQPCSKKFVEFLGKVGIKGQYTGYDSPDDNAYIERLFRTVKEEEIWPNEYDSFAEADKAIEDYVKYYNEERVHSALDYKTPNEMAAIYNTLIAA